jgi:O-antigen ligase
MNPYPSRYPSLLITIVLAATLVISNQFYYASFAGFYAYIISVSCIGAVAGILLLIYRKRFLLSFSPLPIALMVLYVVYVTVNGCLQGGYNHTSAYALAHLIFFLTMLFILVRTEGGLYGIFTGIMLLALLESLICLFQQFHWLPSNNIQFTVTGTLNNPNVTAMFLAMSLPAGMTLLLEGSPLIRKMMKAVLPLLFIALVLLHCRTALIGSGVAAGAFLHFAFNPIARLGRWWQKGLVLLLAVALIAIALPFLYNAKKASADGRKLIWKISLQMIGDHPFAGIGYGQFQQQYNLRQAEYIRSGKATPEEVRNAGRVYQAYNEFLQNGVEGGIPGLLLFAGLQASLLCVPWKRIVQAPSHSKPGQLPGNLNLIAAWSGIACFLIMAFLNFTIQAIPVMVLWIVYAAIIASDALTKEVLFTPDRPRRSNDHPFRTYPVYISAACLLLGGICLALTQLQTAQADRQNRKAFVLTWYHHPQAALRLLPSLQVPLSHYESYWKNYGYTLMAAGRYSEALPILAKAKTLITESKVFEEAGYCYLQQRQFHQAIGEYEEAILLDPTHFVPRAALQKAYLQAGDTAHAAAIAQSIITLDPKVPSIQVSRIKYEAAALLKGLGMIQAKTF